MTSGQACLHQLLLGRTSEPSEANKVRVGRCHQPRDPEASGGFHSREQALLPGDPSPSGDLASDFQKSEVTNASMVSGAREQYKYPVNKTGAPWKVSLQEKDRSSWMWGTEGGRHRDASECAPFLLSPRAEPDAVGNC